MRDAAGRQVADTAQTPNRPTPNRHTPDHQALDRQHGQRQIDAEHRAEGCARRHAEDVGRDQRVAKQPVGESPTRRALSVFANGECQ